ncbi:MAG: DNA polymerase III, subunit gamma/tau [Bacteroidetes bacterium]|nr:MAG: DNA polymerase III, subunit gamma/tau [Bacteroidota bacterium]
MFFRNIIGQHAVKERLLQSVKDGRISHAQLFFGPGGSGSLALAMAYARYIHCTKKIENESCEECPSCVKYNKLVHPDLHFVYPIALSKDVRTSTAVISEWREALLENPYLTLESWFGKLEAENKQAVIATEESGEILRKLSLTTFEAEYKIMIIWLPEKMNLAAANKLLKILEEPPDKTLFLLVTENEGELLRTIVSRTQLVKVNKIADADLTAALIERHQLSETDAQKITYQSDGNYAAALQLINRSELAAFNLAIFQKWMRACLKFDAGKVISAVDELASVGRERQKQFISYALDVVRDCLLMHFGEKGMVRLSGEELAFVQKFSPFVHGANGERFMEELNKAYTHIERNGSPKIIFMDMSFRLNEMLNVPKVV